MLIAHSRRCGWQGPVLIQDGSVVDAHELITHDVHCLGFWRCGSVQLSSLCGMAVVCNGAHAGGHWLDTSWDSVGLAGVGQCGTGGHWLDTSWDSVGTGLIPRGTVWALA